MNKVGQIIMWLLGFLAMLLAFVPEVVTSIPMSYRVVFLGIGLALILIPHCYKFIRRGIELWSIRHKRITVGVAFDNPVNEGIVRFCNEETSQIGLSSKIIFKEFRLSKVKHSKILRQVRKSQMDVFVLQQPALPDGKVPLRFIYKNRADNLIARIVHTEISSMVSQEAAFNIKSETIVVDLNLEQQNIAILSLYIVAICTTLFRGINEGISVFEKLRTRLDGQKRVLATQTFSRLQDLYLIKGRDLLAKKKYQEAAQHLEKAYAIKPKDADLLGAMAITYFFLGNESASEEKAQELLANFTGHPVAHLDAAFFRIRSHKYVKALKQYRCYKRTSPNPAITLDAITFISNQLDRQPEELGLLFARGYLKKLITDKDVRVGESSSKDDLEAFIRRATNEEYKVLVEMAKKLLEKK